MMTGKREKSAWREEKILYFDCYSGISGDMTLGALLHLGVDIYQLREMLSALDLEGYSLDMEKVTSGSIAGIRALVRLEEEEKPRHARHLSQILRLINEAHLPQSVREKSAAIFNNLAAAEAAVHGTSIEKVHFHEVGAVDAIVDIVGVAAALHLLEIEAIYCSPLPAGRGEVRAAHGMLPLPAPATLELLAKRKAPLVGRAVDYELVTPTGAAIVATLAHSFGAIPSFNIERIGYGAGSIDPGYPNYLRLLLGRRGDPEHERYPDHDRYFEESVFVIEATIDDLNPEIYGALMKKLFHAGALDVYYTPVQMKKNRPAVLMTALSPPDRLTAVRELVFHETSTLGIRLTTARKIMRPREMAKVETPCGPVHIKYSPAPDGSMPLHFAPEYEDCLAAAERSGLPLKEIYRMAEYQFRINHLKPE